MTSHEAKWYSSAMGNVPGDMSLTASATSDIWMTNLNCNGDESDIDSCPHSNINSCTSSENVIVRCQPKPVSNSNCGVNKYNNVIGGGSAGVVGGENAIVNWYPWIAMLLVRSQGSLYFTCGGTLIGEGWVLTAAHCISRGSQYIVRLGDHTFSTDGSETDVDISEVIVHPSYNSRKNTYDFALLRLASAVTFTDSIRPICLPSSCSDCAPGDAAEVAGWGATSEGGGLPSILQTATVYVATATKCAQQYGNSYQDFIMLCAGVNGGGVDTCQGDSGGPFMTLVDNSYKLCGATSWGIGCARSGYYGVYSKVCNSDILQWIEYVSGISPP